MAENKIPTIIVGVGAVLFLIALILPVTQTTSDIEALGVPSEDTTLQDVVNIKGEDDKIPFYLTIVALILAALVIAAAYVPSLDMLDKYGNYLAIAAGVLTTYAASQLNGHFGAANDFSQASANVDWVEYEMGGFALFIGAVLALAGGIYGIVASRSGE